MLFEVLQVTTLTENDLTNLQTLHATVTGAHSTAAPTSDTQSSSFSPLCGSSRSGSKLLLKADVEVRDARRRDL